MKNHKLFNVFIEDENSRLFLIQCNDIDIESYYSLPMDRLKFINKKLPDYIKKYFLKVEEDESVFVPVDSLSDIWFGAFYSENYEQFCFNIIMLSGIETYYLYYKNFCLIWQDYNSSYSKLKFLYGLNNVLLNNNLVDEELKDDEVSINFCKIDGVNHTEVAIFDINSISAKLYKMGKNVL